MHNRVNPLAYLSNQIRQPIRQNFVSHQSRNHPVKRNNKNKPNRSALPAPKNNPFIDSSQFSSLSRTPCVLVTSITKASLRNRNQFEGLSLVNFGRRGGRGKKKIAVKALLQFSFPDVIRLEEILYKFSHLIIKASCHRNFSLEVILLDAFGRTVHDEMEIVASLLYADDRTPVEKSRDEAEAPLLISGDGLEFPSTDRSVTLLRGRATFKLKISQVLWWVNEVRLPKGSRLLIFLPKIGVEF